jgi:release factor glutamine methyltransferase
MDRLQMYLQYERPLSPEELQAFKPLLLRRAGREPLQYILGTAGFRELELAVDSRALIPRPETEQLVQEVLDWVASRSWSDREPAALDVGTGSGCIALALAQEGPFQRVVATDASEEALDLARENADRTGLAGRVEFRSGAGWAPVGGQRFDVVVSNPPYVAEAERETLAPEVVEWEPDPALFAGDDGLHTLRTLVAGAADHLRPGGLLALEVGLGQAAHVADLLRTGPGASRYDGVRVAEDLARRDRFVLARCGGPEGSRSRAGEDPTTTHTVNPTDKE